MKKPLRSARKLVTEKEKEHCMGTWEMCFILSVNTSRLKNIMKKHLRSARKLVTEKEKEHCMETWEMCFILSVNTSRLKNIMGKHLRSARKLVTEQEKENGMETWEMCFILSVNTSRLKNIMGKHLRSARKLVTEQEKEEGMETWEMCLILSVSSSRVKNIMKKHLRSALKLVTEKEKEHGMETWEMCFILSVNTSRLKNIMKKHLRSARKLVTEQEKEHGMETWEMCFILSVNTSRLKSIMKKHLRSARKLVTEQEKENGMETWEMCFILSVNTSRPKNIMKKHLRSARKLVTSLQKEKRTCCWQLCFIDLRSYRHSQSYGDKALEISRKSGDKNLEARCYLAEGHLQESLGDKHKAKACIEKALAIAVEIGEREVEARSYRSLGKVFQSNGSHDVAEEYLKKALSIAENIGNAEIEFACYCDLTLSKLVQDNFQEAISLLFRSIEKSEKMRRFLQDSDEIKVSFVDMHVFPYQKLSELFCKTGNPKDALNIAELGRARALADLMATQYSVETLISADPQSWTVVENVMNKESNCTCLYISYFRRTVFLWILKTSGVIQFRKRKVDKKTLHTRLTKVAEDLDECFAIMAESFGNFGHLPVELCEDRSLNDNNTETNPESCQEESPATKRQGKPGNTDDPEPSLALFYELLVNPVSDLLDEPEIVIVPDRNLYRVPFPALLNKGGKYLSERFRIRVVPSLSTLKLILDSPADYHCQTGALIVGDPDVGVVFYMGTSCSKFTPLPAARKEAETIARRLGVWPLIGQDATKKAVLEKLNSVSLIHIAAHGNAERGEIALAPLHPIPPGSTTGIPKEDDYLLKMSDISKVKVRAKLVVLSCCHSGCGQIRAEGVVGIARAFLGAGARSVLVALWALEDRATKKLMSRFYENLVRGESASASLHAAMKWMRDHGFTEVSRWAPFMLIGDDVTFAFEKY